MNASVPKIPLSVLVVIHAPNLDVLLIERARQPGFWQSVTGTLGWAETAAECAARELVEETGLAPDGLLVFSTNLRRFRLDPSLALFADVALHPSFPESELERQRKLLLAAIDPQHPAVEVGCFGHSILGFIVWPGRRGNRPGHINLTGGVFVNQSSAFSDYHGTGGNPSANRASPGRCRLSNTCGRLPMRAAARASWPALCWRRWR